MPLHRYALALPVLSALLAAPAAQAERFTPGYGLRAEGNGCAATLLYVDADANGARFTFQNPGGPKQVRLSARFLYQRGGSNVDATYTLNLPLQTGTAVLESRQPGPSRFDSDGRWTVNYSC